MADGFSTAEPPGKALSDSSYFSRQGLPDVSIKSILRGELCVRRGELRLSGSHRGKESIHLPKQRYKRREFDPWVGEDPLEKEMAAHASILAWEIPWTEEPGGLQSMELQESDTTEHTHPKICLLVFSHITLVGFKVFLTNAANVFLLEPCVEVPMLLKEQVDACKAVLIIFRRMIMELTMNKKTW